MFKGCDRNTVNQLLSKLCFMTIYNSFSDLAYCKYMNLFYYNDIVMNKDNIRPPDKGV